MARLHVARHVAGFVSPGLVASTTPLQCARVLRHGHDFYVQRQRLEESVCRWIFGTLLTARYSSSSETKYEKIWVVPRRLET